MDENGIAGDLGAIGQDHRANGSVIDSKSFHLAGVKHRHVIGPSAQEQCQALGHLTVSVHGDRPVEENRLATVRGSSSAGRSRSATRPGPSG